MSKLARACAVAVAVAASLAGGMAAAQIQGGVARKAAPPAVALGVPVAKANVGQRSSASVGSGSPLSFASGQPALRYQAADLPTAKDPLRREAVKDGAKEPNVSARGAAAAGTANATGEFAPAPGVLRANMPPVTFAEAQRVLKARVLPVNVNQGVTAAPKTAKTSTLATRMKIAGDAAASGPASLAELARSLRHHPDLIYQYVRNNVEYYPTFGLQKGALGAVLDNQATAHDQAALMVELLRASGLEANYVRGIAKLTGSEIGRIVVDPRGNAMIEPVGGRTVPAGRGGADTHTLYPNGSNYQRLNPQGHPNNPTPHGHGHAPGTGPGMRGQGPSLDPTGNVVPWNSPDAHWPIR